jgi:hypothetical protein
MDRTVPAVMVTEFGILDGGEGATYGDGVAGVETGSGGGGAD